MVSMPLPQRAPKPPRPLPARDELRDTCTGCGALIVWAITVAGPNGPGGKYIPLDPVEDLAAGNIAVRPVTAGRLLARALARDEDADRPLEYAALPHFASCTTRSHPEIPAHLADRTDVRRSNRGRRR